MGLEYAGGQIDLDHCLIMGVVNRTPDSFFDGGRMDLGDSVRFALGLVADGAEILDLGAVKAGPGADVSQDEEMSRLLPLVDAVASETGVPISVETTRPAVVEAAVDAGAAIINDVSGLADPGLAPAVARSGAALIVMHNGGQLRGRPRHPVYEDIVEEVTRTWTDLTGRAMADGVPRERIVVDGGLDFGKTTFHSLELVRRLDEQIALGWPVLVAPSRKDVIGETLDLPVGERLEGSLSLAVLSAYLGAAIVRVHDVRASARALRMAEAVAGRRPPGSPVRGLWD
jgi:dihydropteroate synthase